MVIKIVKSHATTPPSCPCPKKVPTDSSLPSLSRSRRRLLFLFLLLFFLIGLLFLFLFFLSLPLGIFILLSFSLLRILFISRQTAIAAVSECGPLEVIRPLLFCSRRCGG
jgi:hypothetical protein